MLHNWCIKLRTPRFPWGYYIFCQKIHKFEILQSNCHCNSKDAGLRGFGLNWPPTERKGVWLCWKRLSIWMATCYPDVCIIELLHLCFDLTGKTKYTMLAESTIKPKFKRTQQLMKCKHSSVIVKWIWVWNWK